MTEIINIYIYVFLLNIFRRNFAFQGDKRKLPLVLNILENNNISAFVETGTCRGDTISFLARRFPNLPIYSCEIEKRLYQISKIRTKRFPNVHVFNISSEELLKDMANEFGDHPFFFLDAHGDGPNPIKKEIEFIKDFKEKTILIDDVANDGEKGINRVEEMKANFPGKRIYVSSYDPALYGFMIVY